jgi:hypothetical protein
MRLRELPATLLLLSLSACGIEERAPEAAADTSCFGARVLSFRDLSAEVVIPPGEDCASGSYHIVFVRGTDTLTTLTESRTGTVGFIGTSDVDGDGRGEFFVATIAADAAGRGALFAYSETANGIERFPLASLEGAQLEGYQGHDRFGFGGADQLVRAFPRAGADTAWFGYSHGEKRWSPIPRPAWVR